MAIGCILGMFPLLFFKDDEKKKKDGAKEGTEETQTETQTPAPAEGGK